MALFSSQKNLAEQVLSTNKFQKQSFFKKNFTRYQQTWEANWKK